MKHSLGVVLFGFAVGAAFAATTMPTPTSPGWQLKRSSYNIGTPHATSAECWSAASADAEARDLSANYRCVRTESAYVTWSAAPPPAPTCTTPKPADETRTQACPTGTAGSWSQTRSYGAAPYPTCWTAATWVPMSAPDGACTSALPPSGYAVPFAAASSWNRVVPTSATYTRLSWPAATGWNYWINWENYSPALVRSASTDPVVSVSMSANWGWPAGTVNVRIARGVSGAAGTDGELLVVDGDIVHNFWQFRRTSDTTATTQAYGRANAVTGSGWGSKSPFLSAGITAAGHSMLAGLLVQAETDAGEIKHALAIAADMKLVRSGAVGEAINSDGGSATGIVQEAERLAIPRGTAMPAGLSPLGQKVFRAMQEYGAFVIDVAGGTTVLRAQQNGYSTATIDALRSDANKILPLLQRVSAF